MSKLLFCVRKDPNHKVFYMSEFSECTDKSDKFLECFKYTAGKIVFVRSPMQLGKIRSIINLIKT